MMQLKKRTVFHLAFCLVILIVGALLVPIRSGAGRLKSPVKPESPADAGRATKSSSPGTAPNSNSIFVDDQSNGPNSVLAFSCLSGGSLLATDPTYNRVITQSLGTGFGTCTLSASGNAVHQNTYQFNLTGCASFPTQVVITTCPQAATGTAPGCTAPASNTDTVINLYRSGGTLTTGTGTAGAFNPASACTNLVALNDDIDTAEIGAGGSTCDQLTPFTCHPSCGGNTSTSGMYRSLGPGFFSVVIAGFGNSTLGNYNLFVSAPAAGCTVVNSPTATNGIVSGRITNSAGTVVEGAVVRLTGGQARNLITDAGGNYRFENVETNGFYTVTPSRANYNFSPSNRSFSLVGSHTEAGFTGTSQGDNVNPLDTPEYFVRRQYVDVLGREPEEAGLNYWSDQIRACGDDAQCVNTHRRDVAAAFFISDEFQASGLYIYDVYAGTLGRRPAFGEFSVDRQQVVGGSTLDAAKTTFAQHFVQRAEFLTKYQGALTAEVFVDALLQSAQSSGCNLGGERDSLIGIYNLNTDLVSSRTAVVKALADNATFKESQYNQSFVLTEYFAYLRRDAEPEGFSFWASVLNTSDPGNYRGMVCSFVTSTEYQNRFSTVVTRTNEECGQ